MRQYFMKRPSAHQIKDTHALLQEIERRDNWFRLTQAAFFAIILLFLAVLLVVSFRLQTANHALLANQSKVLTQNAELTKQLKTAVTELEQNNNSKLDDLSGHLDCIANFFASPNRASQTLQGCSIVNNPSASGGSTGSTKSN